MKVTIMKPRTENTLLKKRVCAYTRVSSMSDAQGDSLENQKQYFENKIKSNSQYEFVAVFSDRGITGTKDTRFGFQEMIKQCEEGKIDLILVKSISRFARNTVIILEQVRKLREIGVEVHFEEEKIWTNTGDGELMLTVLSSFAQEESRSISENVKWTIRKKFEKGEVKVNTSRFLGYDKDEYGGLVINPKEEEIVKRIFEEYLLGKGSFKIAKMFNKENIPTIAGGKWHDTTILTILKNEKYKGDALLQKTYIEDHKTKRKKKNDGELNTYFVKEDHPAIITEDMWEEVQKELQKRKKCTKKKRNKYELSSKLICSKCGAKLKRRIWNAGNSAEKVVWQCSKYIKEGRTACSGTAIPENLIIKLGIKEETIIKEWIDNGKKCYMYTCNSEHNKWKQCK